MLPRRLLTLGRPAQLLIGLPALVCLAAASVAAAPSASDARIESAARRSYTFRVLLKDDQVELKADQGVVTLTGTVANGYHRSLAESTVADLPGVKSVDNRLAVLGTPPAENTDAWLATKVRTALLFQRNVELARLQVEVKDAEVILSGEADSTAQKELTEEVAKTVEGVGKVTNHIKVVTPANRPRTLAEKLDDASITAQVKASLLFHNSTHMLATRVKTERGVVTLRGSARNPAERDLVTRLVAGVRGVKRVQNLMTLEP
jgi:osmotically-inducible protein OsmY